MNDTTDFPKLDGGWCDGMGCSGWCFCKEHLAMREEFQRVFNKPWKERWDDDADIDCDHWEHIWRFGTTQVRKYFEPKMEEDKKFYRLMMDNKREEFRQLRIEVHQLKKKLNELTVTKDDCQETVEEICENGMRCLDANIKNLTIAMKE